MTDIFHKRIKIKHSPVFTCKCGNKYIKTRGEWMDTCLDCLRNEKPELYIATCPE